MKKKILLLPVLMAATMLTAFARPGEGEDPKIEQAFRKQFSGANDVSWSVASESLRKVSFVWGGLRTVAYFNEDAEMVGSVRNVFYGNLPLTVVRSIDNRFSNPVIIEVREISNEEGTTYRLVLEHKNKRYNVRVNSFGTVLEKERIKS